MTSFACIASDMSTEVPSTDVRLESLTFCFFFPVSLIKGSRKLLRPQAMATTFPLFFFKLPQKSSGS